ncbi:MAG: aminotransferase class V-fold PLP-dependent enzyme [Chitinophagaceae bacterium]
MDKRTFIKNISLLGVVPAFGNIDKWIAKYEDRLPGELASDETFWEGIRKGYRLKPDYINLENGYYCFLPQETLENFINHVREVNFQGSYYMRTRRFDDKRAMAEKLAALAGCSKEELVITRNTTESLDTIIGGIHWQSGDEAVMAEQDYGAMLDMFKLVTKRYAVINKIVSVPNHPATDEEIVDLYANAITPRTKLLMVCHIINITGHILPVKKICDMAHSKGVKVLVDGAHAFGHFKFSVPDLHCDYYGTSLHKWLSVPLGAGFLYVKKENIADIWPLLGPGAEMKADDIYRLNHTGTPPVHTDLAITNSIDYYLKIGAERKEERLRYLQHYWSDKVRNMPNIVLNTPAEKERSCGIANVGIKDMKPADLAETLMKKYKIYTVAIDYANVHGCRITPNIYTTPKELDLFVQALTELSGN